ncbi:MAG: hypothetical protein QF903_03045 [Planctomycetota bacterium]|jgi:hypothetical protein|nr:hypothetical protein [Planctomycetota bacterium]MDP6988434.1 hypothetical protein [Planctomycetota bacterium]
MFESIRRKKGAATRPAPARSEGGGEEKLLGRRARRLNLVNQAHLVRSIDQAVRAGLAGRLTEMDDEAIAEIARTTQAELLTLLKAGAQAVRGLSKEKFLEEAERDRRRILAERERASEDLQALLEQVDTRRREMLQAREELEAESRRSGDAQDEVLAQRIASLFEEEDGASDAAELRERVTDLLLGSVRTEREKVVKAQIAENRQSVENFERRITKLTRSLEVTEEELRRMAERKEVDPGVASVFRTVQGLNEDEDDLEAKTEMMATIFEANLVLQKGGGA